MNFQSNLFPEKFNLKKSEDEISFWGTQISPNGTTRWGLQSAKSCSLLLVRKSNQHVRLRRQLRLWLYCHHRDARLNSHLPGRIHGLLNLLHLERRIRQETRSKVNPSSMDSPWPLNIYLFALIVFHPNFKWIHFRCFKLRHFIVLKVCPPVFKIQIIQNVARF